MESTEGGAGFMKDFFNQVRIVKTACVLFDLVKGGQDARLFDELKRYIETQLDQLEQETTQGQFSASEQQIRSNMIQTLKRNKDASLL